MTQPSRWGLGWSGPAGLEEVIRIAFPMALSTGCVSLALFVDRTLLYQHDPREMAAALAGGNLFWAIVCFPVGISGMTSAFVSQYIGSNQPGRIGRFIYQSVWWSIIAAVGVLLVSFFTQDIFEWTHQPASLIPLESSFLNMLLWAAGGVTLDSALSGFFSGTNRPQFVLWVNVIATFANIVLDLLLIFGWGFIPELGIAGAGLATTISMWLKAAIYAVAIFFSADWKRYGFNQSFWIDLPLMRRFLLFSIPAGVQYLFETAGFVIIILQVGQIGEAALEATTMAINFNMLAFVPLLGLAIAVSVSVGRHLTESGRGLALRATRSALGLGIAYTFVCAAIFIFAPNQLLGLYAKASNQGGSAETLELAALLLRFVAAYCVIDAVQIVLAGALRGAGDTWFVLVAACSTTVIVVGGGWLFEGLGRDHLLYWWWSDIMLMVWTLAAVYTWRIFGQKWSEKRLVEPSVD